MTSWMRARPLPIFFLTNLAIVLVAGLAGIASEVVAFHGHPTTSAVVGASAFALVFSTTVTIGEWLRRRRSTMAQ